MDIFQGLLSLITGTGVTSNAITPIVAPATSTTTFTPHKRGKNKNRKRNRGGKQQKQKQQLKLSTAFEQLTTSSQPTNTPTSSFSHSLRTPTPLPPTSPTPSTSSTLIIQSPTRHTAKSPPLSPTPSTCSTFIPRSSTPHSAISPTPSTPSTFIQQTQALLEPESATQQTCLDHPVKLMVLPDEVEKGIPLRLKKIESYLPERSLWFIDTKDPRYYVYSGIEDPKPHKISHTNRSTGSGTTPPPDIPQTPIIIPLERQSPTIESIHQTTNCPPSPYIPEPIEISPTTSTSFQSIPLSLNPKIILQPLKYIPTPITKLKSTADRKEIDENNLEKFFGKRKERKQLGSLGTEEQKRRWMEMMDERRMLVKKLFFEEKKKGKSAERKEAHTREAKREKERLKERRRKILKSIAERDVADRQEKRRRGLKNQEEDRKERRKKEELKKKKDRLNEQIERLNIRAEKEKEEIKN